MKLKKWLDDASGSLLASIATICIVIGINISIVIFTQKWPSMESNITLAVILRVLFIIPAAVLDDEEGRLE